MSAAAGPTPAGREAFRAILEEIRELLRRALERGPDEAGRLELRRLSARVENCGPSMHTYVPPR